MDTADGRSRTRYFAYGSNLDPDELIGTCPGAERLCPATLPAYRRAFTRFSRKRGGGVADIVPDPDGTVHGAVYDIPGSDMEHLDAKEGVAVGAYQRITVDLQTPGGTVGAMAYKVVEPKGPFPPTAEYLMLILRGIEAWSIPPAEAETVIATARALGTDTSAPSRP